MKYDPGKLHPREVAIFNAFVTEACQIGSSIESNIELVENIFFVKQNLIIRIKYGM